MYLTQYILEIHIRLCGIAITNRRNFPRTIIKRKQNNEMTNGLCGMFYNSNDVVVIAWQDKNPIYIVTFIYITDPM